MGPLAFSYSLAIDRAKALHGRYANLRVREAFRPSGLRDVDNGQVVVSIEGQTKEPVPMFTQMDCAGEWSYLHQPASEDERIVIEGLVQR